jgi:hypothetical protein
MGSRFGPSGKLGVASRRDAIDRARELHLLGPSTRLPNAA